MVERKKNFDSVFRILFFSILIFIDLNLNCTTKCWMNSKFRNDKISLSHTSRTSIDFLFLYLLFSVVGWLWDIIWVYNSICIFALSRNASENRIIEPDNKFNLLFYFVGCDTMELILWFVLIGSYICIYPHRTTFFWLLDTQGHWKNYTLLYWEKLTMSKLHWILYNSWPVEWMWNELNLAP